MQALQLPQPFPPFAKAGGDDSPQEGIMVAFMLPAAVAEALGTWAAEAGIAPEAAVPAEVLHLTLVYVGKVSDIPAEKQAEVRGRLLRVVQEVADLHLPLTGKVNGHGLFVNEDERAYWAAFDSPHLPALRQDLVGKLNGTGVPISLLHGFTPHITLAYLPAGREMPQDVPPAADLTFETLAVAWGEEVFEIQPRSVNTSKSQRWDEKSSHAWQIIMSNLHPPTTKALTLPELVVRVVNALYTTMQGTAKELDWSLEGLYTTFAIVALDGTFYRVDFTVDGNIVTVPKRRDWVEVTREWIVDLTPSMAMEGDETLAAFSPPENTSSTATRSLPDDETLVIEGGTIKAIGEDAAGEWAKIGGYLVKFTTDEELDSYGHHFSKSTDLGPLRVCIPLYDHGQDSTIKARPLGSRLATLTPDDEGVWFETQLNLREKYEKQMYRLAQKGKLGLSSGTAPHLAKLSPTPNGKGMHIDQWFLGLDGSLTVRPAAGPSLTQVMPIKSYTPRSFAKAVADFLEEEEARTKQVDSHTEAEGKQARPQDGAQAHEEEEAATNPVDSHTEAEGEQARPQDGAQAHVEAPPSASAAEPQGVVSGNPNGGAVEASQPNTDLEDNEMGDFTLEDITKTVLAAVNSAVPTAVAAATQELRTEVKTIKTALENEPPINDPGHAIPPTKSNVVPYYQTRFTDPAVALKQVQDEAADGHFYAFNHEQGTAFVKAIRDPRQLSASEERILRNQVFAPTHIKMLLDEGLEMKSIKDMQQMAQGLLGGYAMPPMMQEGIVTALPGRTAFRGNGATTIVLTGESNTYTATRYKNNSEQYAGLLRGGWSSEKGDPNTANYELETVDIKTEVYLYKVPKTTQELRLANLQQMLQRDILNTMAVDEDRVFTIGDGIGKPLGVLPGGANTLGWKVVPSGNASTLTTAGIKKLKRGLPSQYRARGVFIANSDTYGDIETLTVSGTGSDFAFPSLAENDTLLRRPAPECAFMPDVAVDAFPILYCAPEGYYIVEVPGMAIERLQDTRTSINKVEIHVMKLIGGRPVEPWNFAVQKVAAS